MDNRIFGKPPHDFAKLSPAPVVGSEKMSHDFGGKVPFQVFYDGYQAGRKWERLQMDKEGDCAMIDAKEAARNFDRGVKWERQRTHADSVFARVEERGDGQSDSVLNAFVWMGIGMVLVCLLT